MAHKIDNSKGFNAFVAFQMPAWHNLGKVFQEELNTVQALTESGQDYNVSKWPNIHRLPSGIELVSKDSFFTMRDDTAAVLGSRLGTDYTVLQNKEAFDIVDEILKTGKARIETAGAIDGGKRVFICLKVKDAIVVGKNDSIDEYLLICNSHDGTLAITAMFTPIRVVCNNTLSAALAGAKGAVKIRHTARAEDRLKEAMKVMGMIEESSKLNAAAYNAMAATDMTKQEFFNYIGNIFMTDEEIKKLQKGEQDVLSTRKKNIINDVLEFAEVGVGQREALQGGNRNGWFAYNAITGYLTGKKYGSADDRFNSLMLGDSAAKIRTAGELILNPGKIQSLAAKPNTGGIFLN